MRRREALQHSPHLAKLLLQLPLHFCDVGTPILRHRNKVECVPKGVNLIR